MQPKTSWIFRVCRGVVRWLSLGYLQVRVEGLDAIPSQGGAVVAGNHASVLDGILLLAVSPRPVRFLVAEDMYEHPFLKPFFRAMGCIPVLRRNAHNGGALRMAVEALETGELIGIFPEGTIHRGGSLQQIRQGVALLALKTGLPVVPLGICGSGEAFPDGARAPHAWPISMRFGGPRTYARVASELIPEVQLAETLEEIRQLLLQALADTPLPAAAARPALKEFQLLLSTLVVVPLAWFLTLTAHPSLDPIKLGTQGDAR